MPRPVRPVQGESTASQPGCCAAGVVSAKKDCAHTKTHVNTRAHVKGNAVND